MPRTTITKFWVFVILAAVFTATNTACSFEQSPNFPAKNSSYGAVSIIGTVADGAITESSGVVASRCNKDILWTHNDSGDDAFIFAMHINGAKAGTWKLPNAQNFDWEDIATTKDNDGKCYLYIGEIGDNSRKRESYAIYKIREPDVTSGDASSSKSDPRTTEAPETLRFTYPDGGHNAETLMVHPTSGDIYIVTKRVSGPSAVYKLKGDFRRDAATTAEKIADISFPAIPNGFVTGGDISFDGTRVAICDYSAVYELVLPTISAKFDAIWSSPIETIDVGSRAVGEAISYTADGNSLILTSEGKNKPILVVSRKQ